MQTLAYISIVILLLGTTYVLYNVIMGILRALNVLFIPNKKEKTR